MSRRTCHVACIQIDGGATYTEPTAIINGKVEGLEDVPLRVHDACFTSEVLGSLKCDCAEQLAQSLEFINDNPPGMVIYLQQEGRGIGLANKIAAYSLQVKEERARRKQKKPLIVLEFEYLYIRFSSQEKGMDTVDANRALGLPDDCREYTSVRNIMLDLGIKSIRLITNNPRKIDKLTKLGIVINGRIPSRVEAGKYNQVKDCGVGCVDQPLPSATLLGFVLTALPILRATWTPSATAWTI